MKPPNANPSTRAITMGNQLIAVNPPSSTGRRLRDLADVRRILCERGHESTGDHDRPVVHGPVVPDHHGAAYHLAGERVLMLFVPPSLRAARGSGSGLRPLGLPNPFTSPPWRSVRWR